MPAATRSRSRRSLGWTARAALIVVCFTPGLPTHADVFRLRDGATIDGEVVSDDGEALQVRVVNGVVTVPKAEIVRRETAPPPWVRYEQKRKDAPDTAQGHYELALWCKSVFLSAQMKVHLRLALQRDPNFAPARRELGHVRRGIKWVEPPPKPRPKPPSPEELAAAEQDKLIRQVITNWFVRARAIKSRAFDGPGKDETSALFKEGRRQILAIKDPLALPALAGVLSTGSEATRRLLVDALAQFPNDEATMNLVVISLFEPLTPIRRAAAVELIGRKDPRVVEHLRRALASEEEQLLRNAAVALGIMRAAEAVEDLIPLLETRYKALVRTPRDLFIEDLGVGFLHPFNVSLNGQGYFYWPRSAAVLGPGTIVGTYWTQEYELVSLYRTEVQEALIAITGKNFGFDVNRWREWWRHQGPQR